MTTAVERLLSGSLIWALRWQNVDVAKIPLDVAVRLRLEQLERDRDESFSVRRDGAGCWFWSCGECCSSTWDAGYEAGVRAEWREHRRRHAQIHEERAAMFRGMLEKSRPQIMDRLSGVR